MAKKKAATRKSSPKQPRKRSRTVYRLACAACDREDFDGIYKLPTDWGDITRHQTYPESLQEVAENDPVRSALEWYTHLGVCPECQELEGR